MVLNPAHSHQESSGDETCPMSAIRRAGISLIGRWKKAEPNFLFSAPGLYRPVFFFLILALAFGLRMRFADIAYPAQLDTPHMIHQGIFWAQGEPGALATIWQEAPCLTAGIAYRLGFNPAEALQWSTVIYGTILVGMTMLLTHRMFKSDAATWLAGGWAAANQGLVEYSINSMPEIGFAACLLGAYAIMANALCGRGLQSVFSLLGGYGLLGLGIYFKPLDSLTALALATGWLVLLYGKEGRQVWLRFLAGPLIFIAVATPHYLLQSGAPGANGVNLVNRSFGLVAGEIPIDSQFLYAVHDPYGQAIKEYEETGALKWLWEHRARIVRRYFSNVVNALRIYGNYLFPNAFRMGNAWFVAMLSVIAVARLFGPLRKTYLFLFLSAMAIPLGVSVSFIFDRWLVIYIPILIAIVSAHLVLSPSLWDATWKKTAWVCLWLAMVGNSVAMERNRLEDKAWHWANQRTVSAWLRQATRPDERIMSLSPSMSLEIDLARPRRWVQLKAGTPEQIEQYAQEQNASYIVLTDRLYPHWPINQLVRGETPPANWVLAKEEAFVREHPVWGTQTESYRIFKRTPPPFKEQAEP